VRPLRIVAVLLAAAAIASCGGGPMPTVEEYSYGTVKVVGALPALFVDGSLDKSVLQRADAASALQSLAATWRKEADGLAPEIRIVDFQRDRTRRALVTIQVRLRGTSRTDAAERLATTRLFLLKLVRASREAPWKLDSATALDTAPAALQRGRPHLTEEAKARGISAVHESIDPLEAKNIVVPAVHHHPGVLLVDVDGDGALDVILPNKHPQLFLNDGAGRFRDATRGSGLDGLGEMEAAGGVAADVDGDGLPELFLSNHLTPSKLFKNLGHGKFQDVTAAWGLEGFIGPYTSAMFFDADGDGRLDLFVACYGDARKWGPFYNGRNGEGDRFFRNVEKDGHPFFVDETELSGLGDIGWGFAVSACDFDGDGDDDLYIANDFGIHAFYENRSTKGHPRFVDIAKETGTEDEGYGMGVTWGDYDGDGRFDFHVTNYWSSYAWILHDARWPMPPLPLAQLVRPFMAKKMLKRTRGDSLFRNGGGKTFTRTSEEAGVADGGWAWGTEFVDLDGDGREDLLVVNGMFRSKDGGKDDEVAFWNGMGHEGVTFHDGLWGGIDFGDDGMASRTPKKLFMNRGDGTFEDRAFVEGFDTLDDTRGLAFGDLDGDGAPEVVVSCFRGPLLLYENGWKSPERRIRVLLSEPSGTNRDALGAVVTLTAGGKKQIREVRAGSSYLSQSSRELLFGIGEAKEASEISVRWPGGRVETTSHVPGGARVVWSEGSAPKIGARS
jgi:enediyne biosynthesis protein E4